MESYSPSARLRVGGATVRKREDKFRGNGDVNTMRRSIVAYRLVLLWVVGLCPTAIAGEFVGATAVSDEARSLGSLVRSYLQESSDQSPDELLARILNHPEANVQTVETAIRAIPHYGKTPLGSQPSSFGDSEREEGLIRLVCSFFLWILRNPTP